jgi:hypothetical protein
MLAQFAIRLMCGNSLMLALMPRKTVASGFYRVQMLILLGLGVLAVLATGKGDNPGLQTAQVALSVAVAAIAFLGSVMWTLERRAAGVVLMWAGFIASAALLLVATRQMTPLEANFPWGAASEFCSSALLGGALTAMLLGHSYLTAPTMSITPLSRMNLQFGAAVVARLILSAVALSFAWPSSTNQTLLMWLALRWLAGILGPLVVCWMTVQILKLRNTQAATGVLFVGVILTFIGELSASLLYYDLKIPF